MAQDGSVVENTTRDQCPTTRIEEILRSCNRYTIAKRRSLLKQTTTNSAVDLEEKASQSLDLPGNTELTIVAAASHTAAGYLEKKLTLIYKNASGDVKTADATLNDTDATTEVAFVPAVTDFYEALALISEVAPGTGHTFGIGPTGNLTYGIIRPPTKAALLADLYGVGSICAKQASNQNADKGKILKISYLSNFGAVETATATLDADNTTTAVRFYKENGRSVNDFAFIRTLDFELACSANILVYDKTGANKIYAVIKSGNFQSLHTKFYVQPQSYVIPIIHKVATTQQNGSIVRFIFPAVINGDQSFDLIVSPVGISNYVLPFGAKGGNFKVQVLAANAGDQGVVSMDLEILEVRDHGFV